MKDPGEAIQRALYTALAADSALTTLTGGEVRVWDRVPTDPNGKVTAKYPYVSFGDDGSIDDGDTCLDGAETEIDVHVWSQAVGKVEAKRITDRVAQVCDDDLTLSGFDLVTHEVVAIRNVPNDGLITHRVVTLRYRTNPTS